MHDIGKSVNMPFFYIHDKYMSLSINTSERLCIPASLTGQYNIPITAQLSVSEKS